MGLPSPVRRSGDIKSVGAVQILLIGVGPGVETSSRGEVCDLDGIERVHCFRGRITLDSHRFSAVRKFTSIGISILFRLALSCGYPMGSVNVDSGT